MTKKKSRRGNWSDEITDDQYRAKLRGLCKVNENGCWIYQGWCHPAPREYGHMSYRGQQWRTHRLSYFLHKGPIPAGMVVCHSCDRQKCCNPDHLWAGTQRDNLMDSVVKKRHRCSGATKCKKGHPYDEANTYVTPYGARACKACARARQRIATGWPKDLAYSAQRVPAGYSREILG